LSRDSNAKGFEAHRQRDIKNNLRLPSGGLAQKVFGYAA